MKKLLSVITIFAMLLLMMPAASLAAEVEKLKEDFSTGYTIGQEVQTYDNWFYYEAGTGSKNGNMTIVQETDGNIAALLEHNVQGTNGTSKNLTYSMKFPEKYSGIVTIKFSIKLTTAFSGEGDGTKLQFFVDDDATAESRGNNLLTIMQGYDSGKRILVTTSTSISKNNSTVPTAGSWAKYEIVLDTYKGDVTVKTLDGFSSKITRELINTDGETGIKGKEVGALSFNIARDSEINSVMIDDIIVTEDKIDLASEFTWDMISSEGIDSVTSDLTLPSSFTTHGITYAVNWSSDNEAINAQTGVVTQNQADTAVKLSATFTYESESYTKNFDVTVKKYDFMSNFTFESINPSVNTGSVEGNINLPSSYSVNGMAYDLSWNSSNADIISADGKVVRTAFDMPVTLTAEVTANGEEVGTKSFDVTVAAERTNKFFNDNITGTVLGTLGAFSADATADWTIASTNSIAAAMQYPSIVSSPTDSTNSVLEIRRTATKTNTTNYQSQVYRKLSGVAEGGVKYVSFNLYRTNTTSRIDMGVLGTNGKKIATVGIDNSSGKLRDVTDTICNFTDQSATGSEVALNTWVNITLKIDFTEGKTEAYVNGKYAGSPTMYYNLGDADKSNTIGFLSFDVERNGTNPAISGDYSTENPGIFYIDDICVRDAADDAYGVVSVSKADNKITDVTFRKISNIDETSKIYIAVFKNATELSAVKAVDVAVGNSTNSIFKASELALPCPAGSTVRIFNFSDSLVPLSAIYNE